MKTKGPEEERKLFEQWAMPKLKEIQNLLLLGHYDPLRLEYNTKNPKISESQYHYPYQSITIRYSDYLLQDFQAKKHYDVLAVLTHEMCHVLTDPFYSKACNTWRTQSEVEDERERLTDHIANIVMKASLTQRDC